MNHTYSKEFCEPCDSAYRSYACTMSQDQLNGLVPNDSEANTGSSNKPTPVPTTILETHLTKYDEGLYGDDHTDIIAILSAELEDYYNTKYTTRLKKCIGEEELLEHPNNLDNALAAAQNVLRAEILKNWEAEK